MNFFLLCSKQKKTKTQSLQGSRNFGIPLSKRPGSERKTFETSRIQPHTIYNLNFFHSFHSLLLDVDFKDLQRGHVQVRFGSLISTSSISKCNYHDQVVFVSCSCSTTFWTIKSFRIILFLRHKIYLSIYCN